jgi:hypothetical protein
MDRLLPRIPIRKKLSGRDLPDEGARQLTCLTFIELLEYVLRNAAFAGRSSGLLPGFALEEGAVVFCARDMRAPRDEPDDNVSKEPPPSSSDPDATGGRGGKGDSGAR